MLVHQNMILYLLKTIIIQPHNLLPKHTVTILLFNLFLFAVVFSRSAIYFFSTSPCPVTHVYLLNVCDGVLPSLPTHRLTSRAGNPHRALVGSKMPPLATLSIFIRTTSHRGLRAETEWNILRGQPAQVRTRLRQSPRCYFLFHSQLRCCWEKKLQILFLLYHPGPKGILRPSGLRLFLGLTWRVRS